MNNKEQFPKKKKAKRAKRIKKRPQPMEEIYNRQDLETISSRKDWQQFLKENRFLASSSSTNLGHGEMYLFNDISELHPDENRLISEEAGEFEYFSIMIEAEEYFPQYEPMDQNILNDRYQRYGYMPDIEELHEYLDNNKDNKHLILMVLIGILKHDPNSPWSHNYKGDISIGNSLNDLYQTWRDNPIKVMDDQIIFSGAGGNDMIITSGIILYKEEYGVIPFEIEIDNESYLLYWTQQ